MVWLKTGSVERDTLVAQRPEDSTINSTDWRSWKGVKCGLCGIGPVRLIITGKVVGGG